MVLEPKKTTLAYRCPHCGAGVISAVGMFRTGADMLKLKCDCGNSELTVVFTRDGQVRLTVPCFLCPKPHNFPVKQSLFFGKDLFCLQCPYSDVNICMLGETNAVKAELSRTELELLQMLEENGVGSFEALHREDVGDLPDPEIQGIVMFVIRELDAEGKITCHCKRSPGEEGNFDVEVRED